MPAVTAPKAWITGLFPRFHATEERIERFSEVLYHRLQNVAMDVLCIWVGGFARFHPSQLLVLVDGFTALLIRRFAFGQTIVVEKPAGLQSRIKQPRLGATWVQAIEERVARDGWVSLLAIGFGGRPSIPRTALYCNRKP